MAPVIYRLSTGYLPVIYRLFTGYLLVNYRLSTGYLSVISGRALEKLSRHLTEAMLLKYQCSLIYADMFLL